MRDQPPSFGAQVNPPCEYPLMIGMLSSLVFMVINLVIQVMVRTIRLTFLMIKLLFELLESAPSVRH
jgi:hypothetical protein